MKHGVAIQHGGRARVDFHPLGQGRSVCVEVSDLHRLPSCVLWARACALTCQTGSASEGACASEGGTPRKAFSVNPWSCDGTCCLSALVELRGPLVSVRGACGARTE